MKALDRVLQRWRIAQVLPYVKPGDRVLDIGCGNGALHGKLDFRAQYVGVDPDAPTPSVVNSARFVRSVFPAPDLSIDGEFDVIAALAILEHVPSSAQRDFARSVAGFVRSGGVLVLTVPSPVVDGILALLKRLRLVDGMHDEQHYGFRPAETVPLFSAHGLVLERHRTFELGLNHLFVFRKTKC